MILFFDLREKFFAALLQIIIRQYVDYNTISMKVDYNSMQSIPPKEIGGDDDYNFWPIRCNLSHPIKAHSANINSSVTPNLQSQH